MGCGASSFPSPPDRDAGDFAEASSSSNRAYNTSANALNRPTEDISSTTVGSHNRHVYDTTPIANASSTSAHADDSPAFGHYFHKDDFYKDDFHKDGGNERGQEEAGQPGKIKVNFNDDGYHLATGARDGPNVNPDYHGDWMAEAAKTEKSVVAVGGVVTASARRSRTANDFDASGYTENDVGLMEQFLDFRTKKRETSCHARPLVSPGDLYTDTEFDLQHAIQASDGLEWKRPGEFRWNAKLFTDGTTRFDIGQGSAGTCWFLSTIASLASEAALLKQVVPDDAYRIGTDRYDGVFHARFWRFGKWEDVYIDDYLPIVDSIKPWGAHSASDENEMWVALLEKAFARYHGSYDAVYGGQSGDAYMALTGGIGESIDVKVDDTSALFSRLNNAISSGAQVMCNVPDEHDGQNGLIGGHAYTLTGVAEVDGTKLLRVRNPWGHTEWTGAWSDRSPEWADVAEGQVKREDKDDGEFWVNLTDFKTYFSEVTICSLTPDFDQDGASADDLLNYVLCVFDEWKGKTAAGFSRRLENPRFMFSVPDTESQDVPMVVQLVQEAKNRQDGGFPVRCDIVKVEGGNARYSEVEILGEDTNVYRQEVQTCTRHRLVPGTYAVLPSTDEPGLEGAFLIRVFSPCPLLHVWKTNPDHKFSAIHLKRNFSYKGRRYSLGFNLRVPGAWVHGVNAGGQIGNEQPYATNPQFHITLRKDGPVIISVLQDPFDPLLPIGVRLYHAEEHEGPLDYQAILDRYDSCPATTSGVQHVYINDWNIEAPYMLAAGSYLLVVHTEDVEAEKGFTVRFQSSTELRIREFQTAW